MKTVQSDQESVALDPKVCTTLLSHALSSEVAA
jgi:hypothetical protein